MLFALAAYLASWLAGSPEWVWRSFPDDGFRVLTPVSLVMQERLVPGMEQPISYHQYHGGSLADTAMALAFVIDHYLLASAGPAADRAFADTLLKESVNVLLQSVGGELIYFEASVHAGHPACLWKAGFLDGQGIIRGKSVLAGTRFYGLQVFGMDDDRPEESMNKFLNSFSLLEPARER